MRLDARYDLAMVEKRCRILPFCAAVALSWFAMQAHAAQVLDVHVMRDGERFVIGMRFGIDAPPPAVFRALQDYSAMMRYNPDLRAVRVHPTGIPGRVRLFTAVHTCVLIFCKTMDQNEIMTAIANSDGGVLESELLPGGGDFKAGSARWSVGSCRTARWMTCVDARIELVPAFWVPPVIGAWVLRRKMAEEARLTGTGLELVAQGAKAQAGNAQASLEDH